MPDIALFEAMYTARALRRLRPDPTDWTRTRLFGAWQGSLDLPYDPLGM